MKHFLVLMVAVFFTGCASITGPRERWDVQLKRCVPVPETRTERFAKIAGITLIGSAAAVHVLNATGPASERLMKGTFEGAGVGMVSIMYGRRSLHISTWDNTCKQEELASAIFEAVE
jgi:hypothetical protein